MNKIILLETFALIGISEFSIANDTADIFSKRRADIDNAHKAAERKELYKRADDFLKAIGIESLYIVA